MFVRKALLLSRVCMRPFLGNSSVAVAIRSRLQNLVSPNQNLKSRSIFTSSKIFADEGEDEDEDEEEEEEEEDEGIKVHFIIKGKRITVTSEEGRSILDVVKDHELEIKGFGACDGAMECATCHVTMSHEDYNKFPQKRGSELDRLERVKNMTPLSRLGCQIRLKKSMVEIEVTVPEKKDSRGGKFSKKDEDKQEKIAKNVPENGDKL